ncbi:hypothetical protein DIPPA_03540 [Diplonema papillatum]|nr:hypothetical protein DIPPA_03540 [Diplonema papillatum]
MADPVHADSQLELEVQIRLEEEIEREKMFLLNANELPVAAPAARSNAASLQQAQPIVPVPPAPVVVDATPVVGGALQPVEDAEMEAINRFLLPADNTARRRFLTWLPRAKWKQVVDRGSLVGANNPSAVLEKRMEIANGGPLIPPLDYYIEDNNLDFATGQRLRGLPPAVLRKVLAYGNVKACNDPAAVLGYRIEQLTRETEDEHRDALESMEKLARQVNDTQPRVRNDAFFSLPAPAPPALGTIAAASTAAFPQGAFSAHAGRLAPVVTTVTASKHEELLRDADEGDTDGFIPDSDTPIPHLSGAPVQAGTASQPLTISSNSSSQTSQASVPVIKVQTAFIPKASPNDAQPLRQLASEKLPELPEEYVQPKLHSPAQRVWTAKETKPAGVPVYNVDFLQEVRHIQDQQQAIRSKAQQTLPPPRFQASAPTRAVPVVNDKQPLVPSVNLQQAIELSRARKEREVNLARKRVAAPSDTVPRPAIPPSPKRRAPVRDTHTPEVSRDISEDQSADDIYRQPRIHSVATSSAAKRLRMDVNTAPAAGGVRMAVKQEIYDADEDVSIVSSLPPPPAIGPKRSKGAEGAPLYEPTVDDCYNVLSFVLQKSLEKQLVAS